MTSKPTETNKLQCPHCLCGQSKVTKTMVHEISWRGKSKKVIKRYRTCRSCGLSFNTIEHHEDPLVTNKPESELSEEEIQHAAFKAGYRQALADLEAESQATKPANKRQKRRK